MAIHINCICGEAFALKDEWAGRRVTCPVCKSPIDVPEHPVVEAPRAVTPASPYREYPAAPVVGRGPSVAPSRTYAPPPNASGPAQRSAHGRSPQVAPMAGRRSPYDSVPTIYGAPQAIPSERADLIGMYHHPLFRRDLFLVNQRMFQINSKYHVYDEHQSAIGFVERPTHFLPMLLALISALTIMGIGLSGVSAMYATVDDSNPWPTIIGIGLFGCVVLALASWVAMTINPLRHSTIYQDESKTYPLLVIKQDTKYQVLHTNYTVTMPDGQVLGYLRKPMLYNLLRKRWNWLDADGVLVCIAREDSLILSLIRRFFGDIGMLIRTNFHFFHPGTEVVIGEFNRKLTIQDRYVLDLRQDPDHYLDRRMALALGIMLDTGERR